MKLLFGVLVAVLLIAGCVAPSGNVSDDEQPDTPVITDEDRAIALCIQACQEAVAAGQNIGHGPCLDGSIVDDWVCDVAHEPRQAVDDLPENQCPEYYVTALHFVEVSPDCGLIVAE